MEIEAVRLCYLIANGKCVISERGYGDAPFHKAVEFVDDLESVVEHCSRLIHDSAQRRSLEAKALVVADRLRLTLPLGGVDMHDSVLTWVNRITSDLDLRSSKPVLEVGSYNVNGSIRSCFSQEDYIGVDVEAGPGVDRVVSPVSLPFETNSFAVVVSTEMLEHAAFPALVLAEMRRVLKPEGVLVLTARSEGFPYHNPPDHFRYSMSQMTDLLRWLGFDRVSVEPDADPRAPGVFAIARKPKAANWKPPQYVPLSGDPPEAGKGSDCSGLLKLYEARPGVDQLNRIASLCNVEKRFELAYIFATAACATNRKWEFLWELALASHYTNRFSQALATWDAILADPVLPHQQKLIVESNRTFALCALTLDERSSRRSSATTAHFLGCSRRTPSRLDNLLFGRDASLSASLRRRSK